MRTYLLVRLCVYLCVIAWIDKYVMSSRRWVSSVQIKFSRSRTFYYIDNVNKRRYTGLGRRAPVWAPEANLRDKGSVKEIRSVSSLPASQPAS